MESLETKIFELFRYGDTAAQKAFVKECPAALGQNLAMDSTAGSRLDVKLMILNGLVESYSRGVAPELGVAFSKAIFGLSREAYFDTRSRRFLAEAARAAINCALGYKTLGEHHLLISFTKMVEFWLDEEGFIEYNLDLLLYRAEATLNLGQCGPAGDLLEQLGQEIESNDLRGRYLWYVKLCDRFECLAGRPVADRRCAESPNSDWPVIVDCRKEITNMLPLDELWLN